MSQKFKINLFIFFVITVQRYNDYDCYRNNYAKTFKKSP